MYKEFEKDINGRNYKIKMSGYCAYVSAYGDAGGGMMRLCSYASFPLSKNDNEITVIEMLSREIALKSTRAQDVVTDMSIMLEDID